LLRSVAWKDNAYLFLESKKFADVHSGIVEKAATQQKIRAVLEESFKNSTN
jgi:hypothetical protein